jgi:hypothetical protein
MMMNGTVDQACTSCGSVMDEDMAFCPTCGTAKGEISKTMPIIPLASLPPSPVAEAELDGPAYAVPPYHRPHRNPRQMASTAAGVMIIIAGIFSLIFGWLVLEFEVLWWGWEQVDTYALISSVAYILAFIMSLVAGYCAFRLINFPQTIIGGGSLILAFFLVALVEPFIMLPTIEILILASVSLFLLVFARPVYVQGYSGIPSYGSVIPR